MVVLQTEVIMAVALFAGIVVVHDVVLMVGLDSGILVTEVKVTGIVVVEAK